MTGIYFLAQQPPSGPWPPHSRGFSITHNDAPQSVGLLWTSDQLVAETSTWQHTTITTDIHAPGGNGTHNPIKRVAVDLRLRPSVHGDRLYIYKLKHHNVSAQTLYVYVLITKHHFRKASCRPHIYFWTLKTCFPSYLLTPTLALRSEPRFAVPKPLSHQLILGYIVWTLSESVNNELEDWKLFCVFELDLPSNLHLGTEEHMKSVSQDDGKQQSASY